MTRLRNVSLLTPLKPLKTKGLDYNNNTITYIMCPRCNTTVSKGVERCERCRQVIDWRQDL